MTADRRRHRPELWGGIECTYNRVGTRYHSQLVLSGHLHRPSDLELVAALGIRTLRYPVLWEMVAPTSLRRFEWSWPDERLLLLRELGIEPIVGLLHHGSGPSYTSLVDPDFPSKLAGYAASVAERYPWLRAFTPVNEPLTTARFSGLYGHWYPHHKDNRSFVRALFNQCRGVVDAMAAIRRVIPGARLVFTEDLGRSSSTELLAYQAEFENHRRWLSIDLVSGMVGHDHPLRPWLSQNGACDPEFDYFLEHPTPPDTIGINYYLTSDRYLDERLERYPAWTHGGNGRHRYADVEAVRACPEGIAGHAELLRAAWSRYGREVAVSEVHLGGTREEQLRWFHEAWQAAVSLRAGGVGVRAVTAWALFGSFDWDSLFTEISGHYEPGAFDVRGPVPRPTALADGIREIARSGGLEHHTLGSPGWWRRPLRFLPQCRPADAEDDLLSGGRADGRPLLIVGQTGALGQAFARSCRQRGIRCHLLSRSELDIASPVSVAAALDGYRPWALINAAGFVRIDAAEVDRAACFRENTTGPAVLATECAKRGTPLVTFSSDMVFSGTKGCAYLEGDPTAPINIYGKSKAEGERQVLMRCPRALVVRSSAFFGPWDQGNFVTQTLGKLAGGETVAAASDVVVSPTYLPDLVDTALDLLLDRAQGIWHVCNHGSVSWAELARLCSELAGLDPSGVIPRPAVSLGFLARRPPYSALTSARGASLPSLENALLRYFSQRGPKR